MTRELSAESKKSDLDIELEAIAQMLEGGFSFRTALEFVERIKRASPELGDPVVPSMSRGERGMIREELEKEIRGETKASR